MDTAATTAITPAKRDDPAKRSGGGAGAAWALCRRELVRFLRQRNRVIGAIGTPIVFWLVLGLGLNRAFVAPGAEAGTEGVGYLAYFFPGSALLIVMFTAIFATIGVIEDRREGFLQGVMVSPTPRWGIVAGKVLGGAILAAGQAGVFLLAWPVVVSQSGGVAMPGLEGAALAVAGVMLVSLELNAIGLAMAWPMTSTGGFHAIMNLLLMPAWLLSGAVFPLATAPAALQAVMWVNPLTYAHAAIAGPLLGDHAGGAMAAVSWPIAAGVTAVITVAAVLLAARVAGRSGG